jgi:hypothetical protein
MDTNQIYELVNSTVAQAIGRAEVTRLDTEGLISVGNVVLSSSANTEAFLNTLAQRIGRTIYRFRDYNNKFKDMVISDMQFGAIMQKIKVKMPDAVADPTYSLTDGEAIDHYTVSKPQAIQKLFVTRTPYMFKITVQRDTLREAFLSAEAMGSFISLIFGEVRNAIELALENLGRLTLCGAISEVSQSTQIYRLVTMYNTEYELEGDDALTATSCLRFDSFLRYSIGQINHVIDMMQDMSTLYNDGTVPTFTNKENMKIRLLSGFKRRLETVTEYAAFHDQFVNIDGAYSTINFWQGEKAPSNISVKRPSDGENFTEDYVVACIHDRDSFGIYQIDETVLTTPVNAAGQYYNQFWHEKQARFVDTSENLVIFTLG